MELSKLTTRIVDVPFECNGETLIMQVNIDAFTPEFFRFLKQEADAKLNHFKRELAKAKAAQKTAPKTRKKSDPVAELSKEFEVFEYKAKMMEQERETNVDFLIPHILKGWDLVDKNGAPVELTKAILLTFPPRLVQELFNLCVKAARTVKKTEDEVETLDNTLAGSSELRLVGQST